MATTRRTLPEHITNATLGELIAAGLEELSDPTPAPGRPPGDGDPERFQPPAPTRTERATRAMYARAASQLRRYHADDGEGS